MDESQPFDLDFGEADDEGVQSMMEEFAAYKLQEEFVCNDDIKSEEDLPVQGNLTIS
jgi:hypothetical protein